MGQGIDVYRRQLTSGAYVSLGYFAGGTLIGHAGYHALENHALITALVVDPLQRGAGIGRALFDARLSHIINRSRFAFVVGYSMAQHTNSQALYDVAFKPLGLDIGYPDIFHQADESLNRGAAANAELVLCRRLSGGPITAQVPLSAEYRTTAQTILAQLSVVPEFRPAPVARPHSTFLGFHPTADRLLVPAFINPDTLVAFGSAVGSSLERQTFIDELRGRHESTSAH